MTRFALPAERSICPAQHAHLGGDADAPLDRVGQLVRRMRVLFVQLGRRSRLDLNLEIVQPPVAAQNELVVRRKAREPEGEALRSGSETH